MNNFIRPLPTLGKENANSMAIQISVSRFERYTNLKHHAVQLAMQHRAIQSLMWFSSENCYFSELQDGPNTALEHESRELSREIRRFHQQQFHAETHWLLVINV